ncbi:MAG TPA: SurA N-terminal domain-containing protein [Ramlibacter sp.]|nr:SurA N-terminal domain-containing protein [Ramlibacter sp.]
MFDFVRKHNKLMQFLLFLLIVPSFVLLGVQGYETARERGAAVAKVDGHEISKSDWDEAHRREVDQLRQQMPNLDSQLLESPQARYSTLQRLVREQVLASAAQDDRLMVGDQRLALELHRNELIAALRGPDGKLDMERYRQLLANRGQTPEMFENQVRRDLALNQVLGGVARSAFTPKAQADVALENFFGRREVQVARFDPADYKARVAPTEAELQAFYKDNPKLFRAPEQADIEYLVLDLSSIEQGVAVNEADLRSYYEQNLARLSGPEQRRASHILVAVPQGASADDKQKAKARAEELLAQVKKDPARFAEVAKQNSQDPGSAAQGGDLDFFARGAMTKPFEDAVFALKAKGDISDVVETEFGYHVIQLTDVKAPKQRSFEEMKPELLAEVRQQQAQRKFAEAAESFANTVYEQPDSLQPAAEKLKLKIHTAKAVTRTPPPGTAGALASPKFLQALFSSEAIERKRNTEAVEFGPNQMVSARIVKHLPARTSPYEEVQALVRENVVATKAAELARKEGEARLAEWKAAPDTAKLPPAAVISRQAPGQQPRQVVEAALRADTAALPAFVGVDLERQGYAVVKVNKALPREAPPPQQAQQELQQYEQAWASAEALALYEMLKDRFKAEILVPQPSATQAE